MPWSASSRLRLHRRRPCSHRRAHGQHLRAEQNKQHCERSHMLLLDQRWTSDWRVARCRATSLRPGRNLASLQLISFSNRAVCRLLSLDSASRRWPASINGRPMMTTLCSGRLVNLVADSADYRRIRKTLPLHYHTRSFMPTCGFRDCAPDLAMKALE